MFFSEPKSDSPPYTHVATHDSGDDHRSSSEDGHSAPLLGASDSLATAAPPKPSQAARLRIYLSIGLALLSAINIAIFPAALSKYHAYPLSESELENLPLGDARLGLDRVDQFMPPAPLFRRSWPDRIARVSRHLANAVWGQGVQVYITVEDSTVMRFPVPQAGSNVCALSWQPPAEFSVRASDLTTKGDISEIEVWQLIESSTTSDVPSSIDELDYDNLSYLNIPVRGELLGVLDLTAKANSTTVDFVCPTGAENLVVELRCQRVACHVSFMQVDIAPRFGFELVRKKE